MEQPFNNAVLSCAWAGTLILLIICCPVLCVISSRTKAAKYTEQGISCGDPHIQEFPASRSLLLVSLVFLKKQKNKTDLVFYRLFLIYYYFIYYYFKIVFNSVITYHESNLGRASYKYY